MHLEIAVWAHNPHAVLLHRVQVRTAREQCDVLAGLSQARANVAADRARAGDQKLHPYFPASAVATAPRWILPVAVRGMVSTIYTFLGHLKSASRSRQYARITASV